MKMFSILLLPLLFVFTMPVNAQLSTGSIQGTIHGWKVEEVSTIRVRLQEVTTSTIVQDVAPDAAGTFTFRNVPFATYDVNVVENAITLMQRRVVLRSAIPVVVIFDSLREYKLGEITVEATRQGFAAEPSKVTTHSMYTEKSIERIPTVTNNKAIESILLSTPGFVPDEDGRLHARGEDAQLQYVVDGIPITGNLTRVYSTLFNAGIVKSMDIQTGGLNAEYGVATSGIINVTTKSGFDQKFFSHASGSFGSFDTKEGVLEVGGTLGDQTAIYAAATKTASDRYLDPITSGDPIHDNGDAETFFGRFTALLSNRVDLNILGAYNKTEYEVPNKYVRTPPQDQQAEVSDYMIGGRLSIETSPTSLFSLMGYHRNSMSEVMSGGLMELTPADYQKAIMENEEFFIGGKREYSTTGGQVELFAHTDWFSVPNNFKVGVSGEVFPVDEFFSFAITNPDLSDTSVTGGDDRYLPYDITQGGTPFLVDTSKTGNRISGYVQDEIQTGKWTINAGLRFDAFKLLEIETAVSPRLGAAYAANEDLVLRMSYNRIVMQAPIENYLVSSSPEAHALVGAEQGSIPTVVKSEKSHVIELGSAFRLSNTVDLDLSAYGKLIDDFIVKVELGNSGVIFPANLTKGRVIGGELRTRLHDWNNISAFLSVGACLSEGLIPEDGSSPVSAGLILGEEGDAYANPFGGEDHFPTEHNQVVTAAFNINYQHPVGLFGSFSGRFDSGLPFDLEGPNGEALNEEESRQELIRRGYTEDVIDLLVLKPEKEGSPDRQVAPHATFDVSAGYDFRALDNLNLRLTFTVLNIFDTEYLYKFESTFGGTHFGVPQTFVGRIDLSI